MPGKDDAEKGGMLSRLVRSAADCMSVGALVMRAYETSREATVQSCGPGHDPPLCIAATALPVVQFAPHAQHPWLPAQRA